jgi:fructokinase
VPSVLAGRIGLDRNGFRLMRYLRQEGVRLINTPNADFTGVATTRRRGGEPSYEFTPSLFRRRIAFNSTLLKAVAEAPAVGVNSFSYGDGAQADALCKALEAAPGLKILDPNPRPSLIADLDAFREGFEQTSGRANLVKLSDEDGRLFYGRDDDGLAESLFERGVEIVLLTRGKLGAAVFTRSGLHAAAPATELASPIVDTMGAGDATLASVIASILVEGMPRDNEDWRACLKQAMDIAAATCRSAGGALVRPLAAGTESERSGRSKGPLLT